MNDKRSLITPEQRQGPNIYFSLYSTHLLWDSVSIFLKVEEDNMFRLIGILDKN